MKNCFMKEIEDTLFSWYQSGENGNPFPVINAVKTAVDNDAKILVPVVTTEDLEEALGGKENLKKNGTAVTDRDVKTKFEKIAFNGKEWIPLFTSRKEMEKGKSFSVLMELSLKDLFTDASAYPDEYSAFIINPYKNRFVLDVAHVKMVLNRNPVSQISFCKGSVLDYRADAVVNAANTSLLGGGGIDGVIHTAAGYELYKACEKLNGCNTGDAKITEAYNLKNFSFIIHAVGPVYSGKEEDCKLLASCYRRSLDLALDNGCSSIAFPGISTGVYGFPVDEAAAVSLKAVAEWLDAHRNVCMNVYFCSYREKEYAAYEKLIKKKED